MPPEERIRIGDCDVLLLGTIAGFVPDGDRVRAAFASHAPDLLALGVPKEDLAALEELWKADTKKGELVEPDLANERLLKLLAHFGPTRIPSPDLEVAYSLAKAGHLPIEAIDLDDDTHAAEYVRRVKVRHLWWAPRREAKLLARPFDQAKDAYDLAALWDHEVNRSRPLRAMETLREETMAAKLRALASRSRRTVAIVPAARYPQVLGLLQTAPSGAPPA